LPAQRAASSDALAEAMEQALSDRNSRLMVRGDRAALILFLHQDAAGSNQERLIYRFQRVNGTWQLIPAPAS